MSFSKGGNLGSGGLSKPGTTPGKSGGTSGALGKYQVNPPSQGKL